MPTIKQIQKFIDHVDELIKEHGADAPLTLQQLKDIVEKSMLKKQVDEMPFYVCPEEADLTKRVLPSEKFNQWLEQHYVIHPSHLISKKS
jgi:uncharacterized protein YajQ (UPF0234 family)